MIHVVLFEPEIPHNTGAVGRLSLGAGARLHLIKPLGFSLDDKQLKRAGLDYWKEVDVRVWESFADLEIEIAQSGAPMFLLTTKTTQAHWDASFPEECYLIFGPETRGLLEARKDACFRIPMQGTRSLNLATAVGIVLYEALRQQEKRFPI